MKFVSAVPTPSLAASQRSFKSNPIHPSMFSPPTSRLPAVLSGLRLPIVAAPMFIASGVELVLAQCDAGICGSFPALNARSSEQLDDWLARISHHPANATRPYAVNLILHQTNTRLDADLALCVKHRVPLLLTSQRAPDDAVAAAHAYGGMVFHDVTSVKHAHKAVQAGVDGVILVCAGAGGHAGTLSPFALFSEVRKIFDGPIALAGAITSGADILAALSLGADLVYMGTRFLATTEAAVPQAYKDMVVRTHADDIVYTNAISGARANYLRPSLAAAGFDLEALLEFDPRKKYVASPQREKPKAWKDIWSAGQGVGGISEIQTVAHCIQQLEQEFVQAKQRLDHSFALSAQGTSRHAEVSTMEGTGR